MAQKTGSCCYTIGIMPSLYTIAVKVLYILGSPMHGVLLTAPVKQGAAPVCTRDVPHMYICMSGTAQWPELALL